MNKSVQNTTKIIVTALLPMTLIGCDLLGLSPNKKEVKSTTKSAVQPAAVVNSAPTAALPKDVLVRIGNWSLSQAEFDERLKLLKQGLPDFNETDPNSKQMVLDELIRQQLLVEDANASDIAKMKDITDAVEDFRKTLMVQELANRLTKDIVATEADAQTYYNENKPLFTDAVKYKAREIVVADEATAKAILVQVLQGGDFAQIATAQSKGKTAAKGGELAEFTKAPFEAMQTAITTLDVGGTSAAFKGPEGYYIVHVDSKSGGILKPFNEVKKELTAGLTLRKQQQVVLEHLNKLAEKYKVEVNQDLISESMKK